MSYIHVCHGLNFFAVCVYQFIEIKSWLVDWSFIPVTSKKSQFGLLNLLNMDLFYF